MPAQDAIALLKADHRKVQELFKKYESARGRKADIAKQICMELIIHSMIEEEIFYPACRDAGVDSDLVDEANVEHDSAKTLIAELENGTPDDEFYDAKVSVLSEEIDHHIKEEEKRGGIFTQARKAELDLDSLGEKLMTRKQELKSQFEEKGMPMPFTITMTAPPLEHRASA